MSVFDTALGYFFSVAMSVLPTVVYVLIIWWLDRYEKEPIKLLLGAFIWGALPAVLVTIFLETASEGPVVALFQESARVVGVSFVAPPVEEFAKGLGLLTFFWFARGEFDDVLDGIVYGALIGFGFAMVENVKYFWGFWQQGGLLGLAGGVFTRALLFGFNHALYTSLTGIGFGLARYAKSPGRRALLALMGLAAAVTAHFMHNFLLVATQGCVLSFLVDWTGVLAVFAIVVLVWRQERIWMQAELASEVTSGVLTPLQLETIISRRQRVKHEWQLLGVSGLSQARLWGKLMNLAAELAFKKHQLAQLGDEHGNSKAIVALRMRLLQLRGQLGDATLAASRVCTACGRPSAKDEASACIHCGTPWPG
jgi:protease PrsW